MQLVSNWKLTSQSRESLWNRRQNVIIPDILLTDKVYLKKKKITQSSSFLCATKWILFRLNLEAISSETIQPANQHTFTKQAMVEFPNRYQLTGFCLVANEFDPAEHSSRSPHLNPAPAPPPSLIPSA